MFKRKGEGENRVNLVASSQPSCLSLSLLHLPFVVSLFVGLSLSISISPLVVCLSLYLSLPCSLFLSPLFLPPHPSFSLPCSIPLPCSLSPHPPFSLGLSLPPPSLFPHTHWKTWAQPHRKTFQNSRMSEMISLDLSIGVIKFLTDLVQDRHKFTPLIGVQPGHLFALPERQIRKGRQGKTKQKQRQRQDKDRDTTGQDRQDKTR